MRVQGKPCRKCPLSCPLRVAGAVVLQGALSADVAEILPWHPGTGARGRQAGLLVVGTAAAHAWALQSTSLCHYVTIADCIFDLVFCK